MLSVRTDNKELDGQVISLKVEGSSLMSPIVSISVLLCNAMIEGDLFKHLGFHQECPSITVSGREGKKKQTELPLGSSKTATSESSSSQGLLTLLFFILLIGSSLCDPVKNSS